MKFQTLPTEATRDMIEATYMLVSTMPRGTPARDKEIVRRIWPVPPSGGMITKRQQRCLEIICDFIDDTGMSPIYQEIASVMGMNKGDVFRIVKSLEKRGFVETVAASPRGIRVLRRT